MIAKNIGQKLRWDYCIVAGLSRSLVYMFGLSMRPFLGCTAEKRRHPRPFFCFTAEKRRRPRPFFCFTAEMRHRPRPFLGCQAIERKAQHPYTAYVLGTKSDIYGRLWDRGVFHA